MAIGKGKTAAKVEDAEVVETKSAPNAKDMAKAKAEENKKKAEEKVAAKAEADEAKAAAKEKEKEEKAAAREAAKEERVAGKGLSKLLRSFLARIKYMVYMDNPAAGIDGIENLSWTLQFTNSKDVVTTVTRGESTTEIVWTTVDGKKKDSGVTAVEELEVLFDSWDY